MLTNQDTRQVEVLPAVSGVGGRGLCASVLGEGMISSGHSCVKGLRGRQGQTGDYMVGSAARFQITYWAPSGSQTPPV